MLPVSLLSVEAKGSGTSSSVGKFGLRLDPIAVSTAIPDKVQTSTRREDLRVSQVPRGAYRTLYLSPKLLTDKAGHHGLDKDILLLPYPMRLVGPSTSAQTAFEAHISSCIRRISPVAQRDIRVEPYEELLERVVKLSRENPALQSRKERL